MGRPMGQGGALGPRVRASTAARGTLGSRCLACTRGPAAVSTRATGRTGRGTDWALKAEEGGSTGESGPRASRAGMEFASQRPLRRSTKALGPTACRTGMAQKHMQMAAHTRVSGYEGCVTGTEYAPAPLSEWHHIPREGKGGGPPSPHSSREWRRHQKLCPTEVLRATLLKSEEVLC